MKTIQIHDKIFRQSIPGEQIQQAIREVAGRINADYAERQRPLFVGVLNGSFMFMGDLMKHIVLDCEVAFTRISSYRGTVTTGTVQSIVGLSDSMEGRHVIIVEDIVDTGTSIEYLMAHLETLHPATVAVATLLFKPDAYKKTIPVDYYALAVPNKFIVGFGLDYNGSGRNYSDIYELDANE